MSAVAAGLNENQVVDAVAAFLAGSGWRIEQKRYGHQRGVDLIARRRDQLLHVEAKGGTRHADYQRQLREANDRRRSQDQRR